MYTIRLIVLFLVSILGNSSIKCNSTNSKSLKETYVGTLEISIHALIKSQRIIDEKVVGIKDNLTSLVPKTSFAKKKLRKIEEKKKSAIGDTLNPFKNKIKAIYPGTYWCGDGNISPNQEDLGFFEKTDACCKAHDNCPHNIPASEQEEGLLNNGIFTRSACDCDGAFYRCLKEADNIVAFKIGITYFNVLRPQCFRKDYPTEYCKRYAGHRILNDKCEEYVYNSALPEILQWFDNPDF